MLKAETKQEEMMQYANKASHLQTDDTYLLVLQYYTQILFQRVHNSWAKNTVVPQGYPQFAGTVVVAQHVHTIIQPNPQPSSCSKANTYQQDWQGNQALMTA